VRTSTVSIGSSDVARLGEKIVAGLVKQVSTDLPPAIRQLLSFCTSAWGRDYRVSPRWRFRRVRTCWTLGRGRLERRQH